MQISIEVIGKLWDGTQGGCTYTAAVADPAIQRTGLTRPGIRQWLEGYVGDFSLIEDFRASWAEEEVERIPVGECLDGAVLLSVDRVVRKVYEIPWKEGDGGWGSLIDWHEKE